MPTALKDKMKSLDAKRREKVEARAGELIAEELSLRDLRRALEKTQTSVAKSLGIGQEGVSRLEQRSDRLLSTLRGYIEAMGGELDLVASFPDRPPVHLRASRRWIRPTGHRTVRDRPRKSDRCDEDMSTFA